MKNMKKLASLLLALVMVFSLATTAFAAGEGSITIENAKDGETYTVYKIFDLSYNEDQTAYSYSIATDSPWLSVVQGYDGIKLTQVATGEKYIVEETSTFDPAEFAALLRENATGKPSTSKTVPEGQNTVTFEDLDLGYYLVDTTLGTLCFLDSTIPNVTITEKNPIPTIEKTVKEDSTGNYGDSNTAQIGDTVEFKTVIKAQPGAEKYVLHDTMTEGLTLIAESIKVEGLVAGTDYTVKTTDLTDGCTFEITFAQTYLDKITEKDTLITVTYSAILNNKAAISTETNDNTTHLDYGENSKTKEDKTTTETLEFDIVKTDSNNALLDGAEFELYDAATDGNKIALVEEDVGTYRVATAAEEEAEGFVSAIIKTVNGQAVIKGLDADTTYYLEEIKAPAGYNKLDARFEVSMGKANLNAVVTETAWTEGGAHIINNAGSVLPETGGMGTTLFYTIGGLLMLAAVVLLVTKKRMAA